MAVRAIALVLVVKASGFNSHSSEIIKCNEITAIWTIKCRFLLCKHTLLLSDAAAESLGLPYLSAYLNSIGSNFTQGANFATAGSSIRRQNTSLFLSGFSPISLDVQSWEFEQFINRSQFVYNNKGDNKTKKSISVSNSVPR